MKKLTKRVTVVLLLMTTNSIFSQSLGLEAAGENFWNEVKGAAPFILAGIFLAGVIMNIGKVLGSDRDYKGFITGVLVFFFILILIGAVITFIFSMSF